ncbi:hypothetical protein Dda_9273 [Drechslerella dactyloides]|uniref:Uncharacterized protein n=1 Tax=Drechslerella dactyloides TaxID=74499 RepID=A0AAD6IPI0_DREDA|nr:hypothetical protein Dda_9273 [Drechslerella dactyloides]
MTMPGALGMKAVASGTAFDGAQATATDRMSVQRDWLDRALTARRFSPEEMRTFLISTVDLIYDQATEISFRTATGLLEQPILDRLQVVTQEDWVFTEGFSEYSWPSHGLPLLRILYRFPKFAGRFGYQLQEGVFRCLFPKLEAIKAFLRKVVCAVQFLYEDDDKAAFSTSVIISLSVFAQVLKIMLKSKPKDACNVREMVVRLILLLPRLSITDPREREEVRRDAKALVALFGLTDDIRIQATGEVKFHFSNAFYNLSCPAGSLEACHFGETWCCLKHQDESFQQAKDRVLGLDSSKAMELAAREAERITSQKEMREKRDRKAIEKCLDAGIEIPSYLRHYEALIERLREERGLEFNASEGKQSAVPVATKQMVESLLLDSSSTSTASEVVATQPDLIDLRSHTAPTAAGPGIIPQDSLLDELVPLDQPLPQASQALIAISEDRNVEIWNSILFKEAPAAISSTHVSTAGEDLLCLAKFYIKESQQQQPSSPPQPPQPPQPTPSTSLLLPEFSNSPASLPPIIPRKAFSVYEPSIFDLSDEDTPDLGPTLQPMPKKAPRDAVSEHRALSLRRASATPEGSYASFYDDSSDSGDSIEIISPEQDTRINNKITRIPHRVKHKVKLACGHFGFKEGASDVRNSKCSATIRKRHPICRHAVEVECGFDVKQVGFKCSLCGKRND